MRQVLREHAYACGLIAGFLIRYATLVSETTGWAKEHPSSAWDDYLYSPDWAKEGEGETLFAAGKEEGQALATSAFKTSDFRLFEDIGRIAGWTSKRPPRNYHWIYAEKDAANGRITGEAWRHFVTGWRETGSDRRHIKGV
jgi:hypothetical protein